MKAVWLKGYEGSNRADRLKQVQTFRTAFNELKKVLETSYKKKEAFRDYSNPNWMAEQIAVNEYNKSLEDLYTLLDLNHKDS